jgi:hypothetical protein
MIAVQVMANDIAVGFGGAGGYLEMNVYKPLMIANLAQSITLLSDGCTNFRQFLVEGTQPNRKKISEYVQRSLMLVTALAPVIGYDEASAIAHFAAKHDLTLKEAALQLGHVDEATFDRVVDPAKMVRPYVANKADHGFGPKTLSQSHKWSKHDERTNQNDCEAAYRLRSAAQRAPQQGYDIHRGRAPRFRPRRPAAAGRAFARAADRAPAR